VTSPRSVRPRGRNEPASYRETAESEYRDEVYGQWSQAGAETRGVMLNKVGQRAGVNEQSLFTGPESECASTPRLS
jgi:hypothetical protein